jgi:signal transduction histidine kinase
VSAESRTPTSRDLLAGRFELLSRIADDIAHEVKNPLHAMVINLEVLKRRLVAEDAPAALERAAVLDEELRRVNGLVHQLISLMRRPAEGAQALDVDETVDEQLPIVEAIVKAARRPFRYQPIGTETRALIRRDSLGFALIVGVTELIAGSLPGEEIAVEASTEGELVRLHVLAPSGRDDDATRGVSGSIEAGDATSIADAMLRQSGGRASLHAEDAGARATFRITLPRATGA